MSEAAANCIRQRCEILTTSILERIKAKYSAIIFRRPPHIEQCPPAVFVRLVKLATFSGLLAQYKKRARFTKNKQYKHLGRYRDSIGQFDEITGSP